MRVLVTRPHRQALATARRLAEAGHEVILAPLLEVVPTGAEPPPGVVDALVVTSQNAVPALAVERARFDGRPIFAVGAKTGRALVDAGFTDVHVGPSDGAALAELVARSLKSGAALLHAAGLDRTAEPDDSLRRGGFAVTVWEVYRAETVAVLADAAETALRAGSVDAVLHYSVRSARAFVRLCGAKALPLDGFLNVCLSDAVAAALAGQSGIRPAVAAVPTEAGLLAALAGVASGSRPPPTRC